MVGTLEIPSREIYTKGNVNNIFSDIGKVLNDCIPHNSTIFYTPAGMDSSDEELGLYLTLPDSKLISLYPVA